VANVTVATAGVRSIGGAPMMRDSPSAKENKHAYN
jgi:hypothetical protein